ncbi:MAG TPA: HD-GYP domain-containing protein [Ktedonobacteraceae bacterium]|nr:HD-GYP domain-containing protein [Ktedonobacteraceae bacterium]
MSTDTPEISAGSVAHHFRYTRLLATSLDVYTDSVPAASALSVRPPLAVDPVANFSRAVRRAMHERFQHIFLQLTPRMKAKDPQLYTHSQRVLSLTLRLLRILDLSQDEIVSIALAAFFHDIGKLYLDDALLAKTTPLTPDEYGMIQQHSAFGVDLLAPYLTSQLSTLSFVYHHHERWDGQGYPCGLEGEAIPLGARIIAVADAFDAMTSERVYQAPRTPYEALLELVRCAGTQFDPRLVRLFLIVR